jgi:hypothetical protein
VRLGHGEREPPRRRSRPPVHRLLLVVDLGREDLDVAGVRAAAAVHDAAVARVVADDARGLEGAEHGAETGQGGVRGARNDLRDSQVAGGQEAVPERKVRLVHPHGNGGAVVGLVDEQRPGRTLRAELAVDAAPLPR